MNLNDLLRMKSVDARNVLVLRHRPPEPRLNRVLPLLAAERPELFNAYQQTQQGEKLERAMKSMSGVGHVASFLGMDTGRALFAGLYSIGRFRPLTYDEYWKIPHYEELRGLGMTGFRGKDRTSILWFELDATDFY